jgi:hypothetical protein
MIKSELISNILELTVEGEKFESLLFEQIERLTEKESEHTRIGLYVYLKSESGIEKHRLSESQLEQMFGEHNHELTKFELINKNENILADLTVHFSNGIIDCVEIWNKTGDYPKEELLTYELKRI